MDAQVSKFEKVKEKNSEIFLEILTCNLLLRKEKEIFNKERESFLSNKLDNQSQS